MKKYLMCQIPTKILKQHAITNSNLHNLKDLFIKRVQKKLVKDELYVCT